jgi:hypothetical protein
MLLAGDGGSSGLSNSGSSFYNPSPRISPWEDPSNIFKKKSSSSSSRDRSWESSTSGSTAHPKAKKSSSSSSRDRSWETSTSGSTAHPKAKKSSSPSISERAWESSKSGSTAHPKAKKSSSPSISDRSDRSKQQDREGFRVNIKPTTSSTPKRQTLGDREGFRLGLSPGIGGGISDRSWENPFTPARYNAGQRDSSGRESLLASHGLDPSGRPIIVTPAKSSEPQPQEEDKPFWKKGLDKVKSGASLVKEGASDALDVTKKVGNYAWDHKGAIGHGALDMVGVVDPFGVADGINAVWYLAEGDKTNAAISAAGMIPYAGDAAKIGKYGYKGYKAAKAADEVIDVAKTTKTPEPNLKYVFDTSRVGATPGKPLTSSQRRRVWKHMAEEPQAPLTQVQRDRIRSKKVGSPTPKWYNPVTGKTERMELSHESSSFTELVEKGSARREGGTKVVPRWPETHAQIDPHRHLSKPVREVYETAMREARETKTGSSKIRKAFEEEVKRWGYRVNPS